MDATQDKPRISIFNLATSGETTERVELWLYHLSVIIACEPGVEFLRVATNLVLDEAGETRILASYPNNRAPSKDIDIAKTEAFRLGRIALAGGMPEAGTAHPTSIVIPLHMKDGIAHSWIECEARFSHNDQISAIIDRIGLAFGWLLFFKSENSESSSKQANEKSVSALNSIVSLTAAKGFSDASRSLVTDLAERFKCDRVSLGLSNRKKIKVRAISNAGKFSSSMLLVRRLRQAMEEAYDQKQILLWPPLKDQDDLLLNAQAELAEKDITRCILTIPLFDGRSQQGAISFERSGNNKFGTSEIETLEALSSVLTPLILDKRHNDRWLLSRAFFSLKNFIMLALGRRFFAIKLSIVSAIVVFTLLAVIERPQTVVADATVNGSETRTISAAFDGFIEQVYAQEGNQVKEGDLLVQLDDRDFNLERLRLLALRSQAELELDRAISVRDRGDTELIQARLRQVDAQLALIDQQILRSAVRAPFDALIVSGDLTRSVGRAVSRGETLLVLSPLNEYQVTIDTSERDVAKLHPGQIGQLKLSAIPDQNFEITITELVPVARYENNMTLFSVQTNLLTEPDILLHGMTGSARIKVDQVPLYVLWGTPLLDRAREWLWRNLPT